LENIHDCDDTTENPIPEKNDTIVGAVEIKRKPPYYVNREVEATAETPVFSGAHVNRQN